MPSININLDFFDHPKVRRLVGTLGRGAEVLPIRLWTYCGKFHLEDGRLADYSTDEIEAIAQWWGEKGRMIDVMVKIGMLDQREDGYYVHDWKEHEGHLLSYRKRARVASKLKWGNALDNKKNRAERLSKARKKGKHTELQWEKMKSYFDNTCIVCLKKEGKNIEIVKDHVVPIYQGGSDGIDNLQPLCRSCNASKGPDKTDRRLLAIQTSKNVNIDEAKRLLECLLDACLNASQCSSVQCNAVQCSTNIPPTPLSGVIEIPEDLKANESEIREWITYKREKGQNYKPTGLGALWRVLRAIPPDKRKDAIENSMACNYTGIFLKGGNNGANSGSSGGQKPKAGKYADFI